MVVRLVDGGLNVEHPSAPVAQSLARERVLLEVGRRRQTEVPKGQRLWRIDPPTSACVPILPIVRSIGHRGVGECHGGGIHDQCSAMAAKYDTALCRGSGDN